MVRLRGSTFLAFATCARISRSLFLLTIVVIVAIVLIIGVGVVRRLVRILLLAGCISVVLPSCALAFGLLVALVVLAEHVGRL